MDTPTPNENAHAPQTEDAHAEPELNLTPSEARELSAHPIGTVVAQLPAGRLALRREIARKMYEAVKSDSWWAGRPERVRQAYDAHPPWRFYTSPNRALARRMYGIAESLEDGECALHMVTAHIGLVNDVVGGVPPTEAIAIDDWEPRHLISIGLCGHPSVFLDPCSWISLL